MAVDRLSERFSFAAGEIGRAQRARPDLARYQVAVEAMENYVTMPEGGATRAPGTRFVLELPNEGELGRLIPWRRTKDDHYLLVFNGGRLRFVRNGGFVVNDGGSAPYSIAQPFTAAQLAKLRSATPSTGNALYLVDGQRFVRVTREALVKWKIEDVALTGGPVDTQNLNEAIEIQASAVTGKAIRLTARGANVFTKAQEGRQFRLDEPDLSLVPGWVALDPIYSGETRRWAGNVYRDVQKKGFGPKKKHNTGTTPPTHSEGIEDPSGNGDSINASEGGIRAIWEFLHPGYGFVKIIRVIDGKNAIAEVITRQARGRRGGVVGQLPDTVVKPHWTYRWYPPAWDDTKGYPDVICFASPRLFLMRGAEFWLSSDFDPEDFTFTKEDDGAIVGRLRSPDGSIVDGEWAIYAGGQLIVGSSDIEWVLRGESLFAGLTSKTLKPWPEGNDGSIPQNAVLIDGGVMYAGRNGKRLHHAKFGGGQAQPLESEEISVWARHIFEGGIAGYAWQRDPHRVLWLVLTDGSLAGVTFMPKQQMLAFHRHPRTNAFFEDVAVIPGTAGGVDQVYFIVKRTINGSVRRYVEQLGEFFEPADKNNPTAIGAWYLDCALRYQGASTNKITGLTHLRNTEVGILAGGIKHARKTVNAQGEVTLDRTVTDALIGIPLTARLLDLPRDLASQTDTTRDKDKMEVEGVFDLLFTGGGQVRANTAEEEGELDPLFEQQTVKKLFSGQKIVGIEHEIGEQVRLDLINDDAMPSTVLSMSPRILSDEDR